MYSQDLQTDLERLPQISIIIFAWRCALRVLPLLACQGENFPFLEEGSAQGQVLTIFRALNAGVMTSCFGSDITSGSVRTAAKDAADAAIEVAYETALQSKSVPLEGINIEVMDEVIDEVIQSADSEKATAAIRAIIHATLVITATTNAKAAKAAVEAFSAANNATASNITPSLEDLNLLKAGKFSCLIDMWHKREPTDMATLFATLMTGLYRLGLDYCAEEYANWCEGRFQCEKVERLFFIPSSTAQAGPKAVLSYLEAISLVRTAEARVVFLGEGRAGKTSLIRSLFGENIREDEKATPRVEIRHRQQMIDGSSVRVHYWDFGGQVIMHATHQFFLREKSIYVVVLDSGRCESLEYWLDHVRVFAAEAPTLIVLNKVDLLPTEMETRPSFDLNKIRRTYPFVAAAVFPVSCTQGTGIDYFEAALQLLITDSQILRPDMPLKLFLVKESLAQENKDFIAFSRFQEICVHQKLEDKDEITTALKVLDHLGVAIHFPTLSHHDVVLNPEWITKAIYFIIWASEKRHLNGKLNFAFLKDIFGDARACNELDVEVPDEKIEYLLDLMTEFKLACKSTKQKGDYLVPMLAPTDEPSHSVPREGGLRFFFSLPFLPPGLFYRFMAESGTEVLPDFIWKSGAILAKGETLVLVEYSDYLRSITFIAHGAQAGAYLTTLRQRMMGILGKSYKDLAYEPYVVTPEEERISWREMTNRFAKEGEAAKIYTDKHEYSVMSLLKEQFGILGSDVGNLRNLVTNLSTELEIMRGHMAEKIKIEVNPNFNPVFSPTFEQKNDVTVSVAVSSEVTTLLQIDSGLKEIARLLQHFSEDEEDLASKHEKEIKQLHRGIICLREDLQEFQNIADKTAIAEAKKKPILGRIKKGWDTFAEFSKKNYYILGLGEKIHEVGDLMKSLDWSSLLS